MLNWLSGLWNNVTGASAGLWRSFLSVIQSVYGFIDGEVSTIYRDIQVTEDAIGRLASEVDGFISATFGTFARWTEGEISSVSAYVSRGLSDAENYATDIYHWAASGLDSLRGWAEAAVSDTRSWVVSDIWNPLDIRLSAATAWIGREGAYAYDLLTHPDRLSAFLVTYLLSSWLTLLRTYAKQVVVLLLSQWKAFIPELLAIAEDIISSIF